jgi:hypothetical protein
LRNDCLFLNFRRAKTPLENMDCRVMIDPWRLQADSAHLFLDTWSRKAFSPHPTPVRALTGPRRAIPTHSSGRFQAVSAVQGLIQSHDGRLPGMPLPPRQANFRAVFFVKSF